MPISLQDLADPTAEEFSRWLRLCDWHEGPATRTRHSGPLRTGTGHCNFGGPLAHHAGNGWTVPQLPSGHRALSTSGVLRSLIRMPDAVEAFADSGFLSCDRAIERVRWKRHPEMMAKQTMALPKYWSIAAPS